jgi:aspartyl-tRNA(Asn)/glutamyl-tRNA(Gln) amidotransferase subunit C
MFTDEDVRRLAALAQLELDAGEVELFRRQLSDILEFARQVEAVETHGVSNAAVIGLAAEMPRREDHVESSLPRDAALSVAPDGDARTGLFKVPRVLNG